MQTRPMEIKTPHIGGKRFDGVRSIDDLRDRCHIDDITGCWVWRYGFDGQGRPNVWMPALRKSTSMGVAICALLTGKPPKPGTVWHVTCRNKLCANPAHRQEGDRSTQMLAAKYRHTPVSRARISVGKRGQSRLSPEQIAEIEGSTLKLSEICARYGISQTHASNLRAGHRNRPTAAPGSSVFSFGRVR